MKTEKLYKVSFNRISKYTTDTFSIKHNKESKYLDVPEEELITRESELEKNFKLLQEYGKGIEKIDFIGYLCENLEEYDG